MRYIITKQPGKKKLTFLGFKKYSIHQCIAFLRKQGMAEKESTFARYITSGNTWNFLKAPEAKKHIIDCYASWDADLSELTLLKTLNINNQEAMETTIHRLKTLQFLTAVT